MPASPKPQTLTKTNNQNIEQGGVEKGKQKLTKTVKNSKTEIKIVEKLDTSEKIIQKRPNSTPKMGQPLNRILIGDVGSGKTLVAFLPAIGYLHGLGHAGQVAMLAPTEILARQHYGKLLEIRNKNQLELLDCVLLTQKEKSLNGQKLKPKEMEKYLENLGNLGSNKVFCIGTQALLFEKKLEPNLVIVDEQHRFGVGQRKNLGQNKQQNSDMDLEQNTQDEIDTKESKISKVAHFLSMTGTPIPRTLALTMYSSLEPIFLQKLEGRKTVKTSLGTIEKVEQDLIPALNAVIANGHKAYVVCAKVGGVDKQEAEVDDEVWSVAKTSKYLETFFEGKVLQVHGKQKDKAEVLEQFRNDPTKSILVATTVIEVGVDVAVATFVAIFNSERFGLSALHQIRGRVGRNNLDSNNCLLLTPKKYLRAKRLHYILSSNDGFELAQKDLELRGSGQMYGSMQSGFSEEIDELMGLPQTEYAQISSAVENLDWNNLAIKLPRLHKYLQKKQAEVWGE